jgi:hypothetical protein
MRSVAVPEETRHQLSMWCSAQVPDDERGERRVGYTIHGDEVTIVDRRAPTYPELQTAWSTTPVARLRFGDPVGRSWSLYRPDSDDEWQRVSSGADPLALLERERERG